MKNNYSDKSYINRDTDNYFMRPYYHEEIGFIYPVKLYEYDRFKELAFKHLVDNLENIENKQRIAYDVMKREGKIPRRQKFEPVEYETEFDFILEKFRDVAKYEDEVFVELKKKSDKYKALPKEQIELLRKVSPETSDTIELLLNNTFESANKDIHELYEIVLHNKVNLNENVLDVIDDKGEKIGEINHNNYEVFKEVVMNNNLLYTPLVGYNLKSNETIQKAVFKRNRIGKNISLSSIIANVSIERGLSDEEIENYTYYRLMFDFNVISSKHYNQLYFINNALGGKSEIYQLGEVKPLIHNPYDDLFTSSTNSIDSMLEH